MLEARDAVSAITGSGPVGVQGVCSGGIVAACALNHLAAEGRLQDCVAHLALLVCLLDARQAGTTSALVSREVAAAAAAQSARTGYIDGESFARVFAWLRPNDLVWNYVVNNYFLGKDPPAFDVLHWNQDTVRMPAGLHRDFLRIAIENPLAEPGALDGARQPRSTCARWTCPPTSWPARPTTSSPPTRPGAAPGCSATTCASCSPPAATCRRS